MTHTTKTAGGWKFSGGRPSLDFVNSVGGRRNKKGRDPLILGERLQKYADLAGWGGAAGVIPAAMAGDLINIARKKQRESRGILRRALRLRESLYSVFKDTSEGRAPRPADLNVLEQEYSFAMDHRKLVHRARGFFLAFHRQDSHLDSMLWPVAADGVDLLVSGDLSRVRQCPGAECGWLFYDESKNGSRQWCDMRACGTLEKVRRFRKRQKSAIR